ncbi:MAG: zinc ABC transporter substrate-binding protein [Planctomycetes bacterium]|nr:zinc ABC transporter substrate-binding protein [Planctomycetota bacterium]
MHLALLARRGLLTLALASLAMAQEQRPLQVCATTSDLGSLCRAIGGDAVAVTVFARPGDDPHALEARPSFIRRLHDADALVYVGLDLEQGWLPVLLDQARNPRVLRGAPGHVDASRGIRPLQVPALADRSQGDVHAQGNPHYLLDPIAGLQVARTLCERFAALRPGQAREFADRLAAFHTRLAEALAGKELAQKYEIEKLALLAEHGRLDTFLAQQGDAARLGGWLAATAPLRGRAVVADHDLYPYLARRFGFTMLATLEPLPGIPPTSRHLAEVIRRMKAGNVPVVLSVPYFDRRHADFVARETGARVAALAHQCGARPGTDEYLDLVAYNVAQLAGTDRH